MDSGRDLIRYSVTGVLLVLIALLLDLISMIALSPPSVLNSVAGVDISGVLGVLTFVAIPAGFLTYQLHQAYQGTIGRTLFTGMGRSQSMLHQLALDQSTQLIQRLAWAQEFVHRVERQAGRVPEFPYVVHASRRWPYVYQVVDVDDYIKVLSQRIVPDESRVSLKDAKDNLRKAREVDEGIIRWMLGSLNDDTENGSFVRQEWAKLDGRYKALGAMRFAILASGGAYALIQVTPQFRHRWDAELTPLGTSIAFTLLAGVIILAFQLNRVRAARDLERHVYHHLRDRFGGGAREINGTLTGNRDDDLIHDLKSQIQAAGGGLRWEQLDEEKKIISPQAVALALSLWDPILHSESDPGDFPQPAYVFESLPDPDAPRRMRSRAVLVALAIPTVVFFGLNWTLRVLYDDSGSAYARTRLTQGSVIEPGRPLYSAITSTHEEYYSSQDVANVETLEDDPTFAESQEYEVGYRRIAVLNDVSPGESIRTDDILIERQVVGDQGSRESSYLLPGYSIAELVLPEQLSNPVRLAQCVSVTAIAEGRSVAILDEGAVVGIDTFPVSPDGPPRARVRIVVRSGDYTFDSRVDSPVVQLVSEVTDRSTSCEPTEIVVNGEAPDAVGVTES